jgi:shikimate dehydrogenase
MISGKAKLAGVMGWPVSHSLSPKLHNHWLQRYGIDGAYVPLPVRPDDLPQALRALPRLGFQGCNLTIPHKEAALSLVDQLDDTARRIGAVNTIVVLPDGKLEGRNTDAFGFAENLRQGGFKGADQAVVLGAGGAARAVIVALQDLGVGRIVVVNRTLARAEQLARSFPMITIAPWDQYYSIMGTTQLLVNTTSLGMTGQLDLTLDLAPLPSEALVTDIVYTPLQTALLRQAAARKLRTIDGLGMLLHQARAGFQAWFGQDPVVDAGLRKDLGFGI